jgi:hypothetical protein
MSVWIRRDDQDKIRERLLLQAGFHNQAFSFFVKVMEQLPLCFVLP